MNTLAAMISLAAVADAIDGMMTVAQGDASALAWLDAWIRATDPGAMDDDAAIAVLVASVPAAAPLRAAREDYAARLRGVLSARGHSAAWIAAALDGMMQDDGAVCGAPHFTPHAVAATLDVGPRDADGREVTP